MAMKKRAKAGPFTRWTLIRFEDEPFDDRAALCDRLDRLRGRRLENSGVIRIEPDAEACWAHVVDALTAALHAFRYIHLGPFDLAVP